MALFKALDPGVEVRGSAVISFLRGSGGFENKVIEILESCDIYDPKPGEWYLMQNWLNAFRIIQQTLGDKALFNIGKKIPESAVWPKVEGGIHNALESIEIAYQMNHRGGRIGSYSYFHIDDLSARILCNNPYPDEFDRGLIYSVANMYKPEDTFMVEVKRDETLPNRDNGAEYTSFIVQW